MSEQQVAQAEEQTPVIGLAGKRKWGYKVSQVDDFLVTAHDLYEQPEPRLTQEEIQLQSFDLERNGYIIGQVDATLIRLEKAVVDKHTQWDLQHQGRSVWNQQTSDLALTLRERAEEPLKSRFKSGEKRTASYDKKQVDTLVDQAWSHISRELALPGAPQESVKGADEVTAAQVSNVIFTQRKGKHGYDEASVDSYLNRIIQILTRMESIVRVTAGTDGDFETAQASQTPTAPAEQESSVSDLSHLLNASTDSDADDVPISFAPAASAAAAVAAPVASPAATPAPSTPTSEPESAGERTMAFSPVTDDSAEKQPEPARPETPETPEAEATRVSSLSDLVHHEQGQATQGAQEAAAAVPPSFAPQSGHTAAPAVPASERNETSSSAVPQAVTPAAPAPAAPLPAPEEERPVHERPVQSAHLRDSAPVQSAQPTQAAETAQAAEPAQTQEEPSQSAASSDDDPEKYISSVLSQTTTQTSSFEIPSLTFPFGEPGSSESKTSEDGDDAKKSDKGDGNENSNA
ncbi:MAG: DivIVA domain-containing protein [Bifidobacteriaceae bacterium]|jgi:DivIVA domain-containing protein|nr:DivIVA domain-containing protein [Bifidobacteriaceae bacterium]